MASLKTICLGDNCMEVDVESFADKIYPVGSIYMSVNNVNPSVLFGGQWEALQNRFLVGAGGTYNVNSTGGQTNQIAATHNHSQAAHSHGANGTSRNFLGYTTASTSSNGEMSRSKVASGSWRYAFVNSGDGTRLQYVTGTNSQTPTINNYTNDGANKNLPPYLAVYMWKRIA